MNEPLPFEIALAPGWVGEERQEPDGDKAYLAVLPSSRDALLRLGSFDPARAGLDAASWVELAAQVHRPRGRPVVQASFGAFTGYRTEFAPGDGRWLRGWVLCAGSGTGHYLYVC